MTAISISRKFLKIIGIILVFMMGILVSFHFWFINHAEELLAQLVEEQSNGQLKLQVDKFRFNWLKRKMELHKAVFYTTNDSTAPNAYRIEVDELQLKLKHLYPLVAEKTFLVDSLKLLHPKITVTNLRKRDGADTVSAEHLSIAQEMGKVYNSIRDALKVLEVDRFVINNGEFVMINRSDPVPGEKPVAISRIDFRLDNLRVDSSQRGNQQKILFSDNVALQTSHQDISFPDGRHHLSFKNFRINLQHRLAEFDSCTISARKGDSDSSSFVVFFDKLKMTDIDFDTLYRAEVIKADSVYCVNPQFRLNINLKDQALAGTPKLDELLLQLAGDLHLKFAVVENGSFDINIRRRGQPSSFVSDHNNFEVQGLRVRKSAPRPVTVERFAMAIRNYENFLRDSSFSIRFDSILVYSNRISLANFIFREYKSGHTNNRVGMPQFELYGLSWDDLVFSNRLKAEQLVLYKPVINYTIKPANGKPVDLFRGLREVNKLLQLQQLSIINGSVNLEFGKNANLRLTNVTSLISANRLVRSANLNGIRQSVNKLMFADGTFSMDDLSVNLKHTIISASGDQLQAASIDILQKNKMDLHAGNVRINSILVDPELLHVTVNDLNWNNASVKIINNGAEKKPGSSIDLIVHNITGKKTAVDLISPEARTSLLVDELSIKRLANASGKISTEQVMLSGRQFISRKGHALITVEKFQLADDATSQLLNASYSSSTVGDSTLIRLPVVTSKANISGMLEGNFHISMLDIPNPFVYVHTEKKEEPDADESFKWPKLRIDRLHLKQPDIYIHTRSAKGQSLLQWKGHADNFLVLENFSADNDELPGLTADKLSFLLNGLLVKDMKGKTFRTKSGQIKATLENLQLRKNDAEAWDWKGKLASITAVNFVFDSLDKNGGRLDISTAKLSNLLISSSALLSPYELVKRNASFSISETSGSYQNKHNRFDWHNIRFDKDTKELALDSFSYLPKLTQEEFIKTHPYQADYAKVKTGSVRIRGADLERFLKDTVLDLESISVQNGWLDDFRDKRQPRQPGLVRPLPVEHLKKFPVKLTVDSLIVVNTAVKYGEFNDKTQAAGWIHVNKLNGLVTNIRNYGAGKQDSLAINATALLEDSLFTALEVKGSYTDPLQGFLMKVQMGSADLRVLNDVLGPLAGASLKSGYLDTMTMTVNGNNEVAYGEMVMAYHDLKVSIAGKPNKEKKSLFNGALNSIVNTILKNKNTDRKGVVFFVRLKDRSAANYLVKITLSGVGSSAGLGKNKRQLRRYLRSASKPKKTMN